MTADKKQRPLTPHLQIYRLQITSLLSILHRFTGIILGIGGVLFAVMMIAAAWFPTYFDLLHLGLTGWWGWLFLVVWVWSFFYHWFNGARHMVWSMGRGFERSTVLRSGVFVIIASMVATFGLCGWWWSTGAL